MIGKAIDGRTTAAKDGRATVGIIMIDKAMQQQKALGQQQQQQQAGNLQQQAQLQQQRRQLPIKLQLTSMAK